MNAILRASSPDLWSKTRNIARKDFLYYTMADSSAYTILDKDMGMNFDLMSYMSYKRLQRNDPAALLDEKTLLEQSQATFSLLFKHFVSSGSSSDMGGWVYQKFGSKLVVGPRTIGYYDSFNWGTPFPLPNQSFLPSGDPAPRFQDVQSRYASQNTTATLTTPVETLGINGMAFWVATGILISLTTIMIAFIIMRQSYLGGIIRDVECIADIIVLIAGGERLLALVQEKGIDDLIKEDKLYIRLGWFEDADGKKRWGIELAEDDNSEREALLVERGSL